MTTCATCRDETRDTERCDRCWCAVCEVCSTQEETPGIVCKECPQATACCQCGAEWPKYHKRAAPPAYRWWCSPACVEAWKGRWVHIDGVWVERTDPRAMEATIA